MLRLQTLAVDGQDDLVGQPMARQALGMVQREVTSRLPTSGWGSPMDLENAKGAERDRLSRQQLSEAAELAATKLADRAAKVEQDLGADVQAAKDAIETEIADFDGLDSLGADLELVDLQRQVNAFDEVIAKGKGALPYLQAQVEQAIRLKLDLKNLRPVAFKICNQVIADGPMKTWRRGRPGTTRGSGGRKGAARPRRGQHRHARPPDAGR